MKISLNDVAMCIALLPAVACEKQSGATSPETSSKLEQGSREHGPPPGRPGGPHAPPPEAYEACSDKQEGDECTVKREGREMTGKCAKPPPGAEDERLICRPEGGPGGRPPGPPPGRD